MLNLIRFIKDNKEDYEKLKNIESEKRAIANRFINKALEWLKPLEQQGLISISVKNEKCKHDLDLIDFGVKALGKTIWIRQITSPEVFEIRIGQTSIFYKDGIWIHPERGAHEVNEDVFDEILVDELMN
ncbi:MAG: hypothetical protein CVV44_04025 [Spirochaetae bacterium HGW-Spirochaetae-1]|jgi:hypothetical protein|nr:MAG: hypothetical protein CVV44_04025 [Spirochaetae bacterium HGW-Spirochaetae-1]